MAGPHYQMEGQRFGRLTVNSVADQTRSGQYRYQCSCDCGGSVVAKGWDLRNLRVQSCGCILPEVTAERNRASAGVPRLPYGQPAINALYGRYRKVARQRGNAFDITLEEFAPLLQGDCRYCGCPPRQVYRDGIGGEYPYNGLDRLDNNGGYVRSNVVSCCGLCNRNKGPMSEAEFLDWIRRVYERVRCD